MNTSTRAKALTDANRARAKLAASASMPLVEAALPAAPPHQRGVLQLRLDYPEASAAELGRLHEPPLSKHAVLGILRRAKRGEGLSSRTRKLASASTVRIPRAAILAANGIDPDQWTTTALVLLCDVCRLPVHGRSGYICCRDNSWFVVHGGCDPDAGNDGYWCPTTRVSTAADLLGQAAHLWDREWARDTNLGEFIYSILLASGWRGRP